MDAYTLRKIAPRILIGVIGINLSIYLCVAAIDITNIIGRGLMELIAGPFNTEKLSVDAGSGNVAAILVILGSLIAGSIVFLGAGGGSGFLGILLMLVLTIMLLVLAIMITLAIRQTLLVLLTVVSPVAIALFILPGTEKYFRQWWDLFLKTLMVYPIIAALFAVSGIMATISFESTNISSNLQGAFQVITGLILIFIPLFMIPFAFRMAGGAMGGVFNAANGMRSQFAGWNRDRLNRANQDPDKALSRGNRAIQQKATYAQLGARERLARLRSPSARARQLGKLSALKTGYDAKFAAQNAESIYSKTGAQVDEVQMDLARYGTSAESLRAIRDGSHVSMRGQVDSAAKRLYGTGFKDLNAQQRQAVLKDSEVTGRQEQLQMFSAMNDRAGRTRASRVAASKSGAALSYGYASGEDGWNDAVSIAESIYGKDNQAEILNHMNEFQYVAKQAGRFDLSGNVNSTEYNPQRSWNTGSLYQHANAKPSNIAAHIKQARDLLQSTDPSQKRLGAVMASEMEALKPNATGEVQRVINEAMGGELGGELDRYYQGFGTEKNVTVKGPDGKDRQVSGDDIEKSNVSRLSRSYERPDPNLLAEQGGSGTPGGGGPPGEGN